MAQGTIQELQQKVQAATEVMRSAGLNTLDYIEHFTYFLFLKLLDDEERHREQTDPTYRTRLGDDRWRFYNWIQQDSGDLLHFINRQLFPHLAEIPNQPDIDNGDLRAIFAQAFLLLREPKTLQQVLDLILTINPEDYDFSIKECIFELLLDRIPKETSQLGAFVTPLHVVDLMVRLINPQIGETIYDPASGMGNFLIRAYQHLDKTLQHSSPTNLKKQRLLRQETIYGREINPRSYHLGVMNMILHGGDYKHLMLGDSLSASAQEPDRYDVILTNPPFGGQAVISQQDLTYFPIATRDLELLFMQHIMLSLKPGGRAAVLVPEGVLFRGGVTTELRQQLLKNFTMEAVISLPSRTLPHIGINTTILFFHKGPSTQRVWFFDMRNGSDTLTKQWTVRAETDQSWWADIEQISELEYILLANRYKPSQIQAGPYPWVALSDLLNHSRERITVADDQLYLQATIGVDGESIVVDKKVYGYQLQVKKQPVIRVGQLVVVTVGPRLGACGLVLAELDGAIINTRYFSYDLVSENVLPEYLVWALHQKSIAEEIRSYVKGSSINSIRPNDFLKLSIPLPPLEKQREIIKRVQETKTAINEAVKQAETVQQEIALDIFGVN